MLLEGQREVGAMVGGGGERGFALWVEEAGNLGVVLHPEASMGGGATWVFAF